MVKKIYLPAFGNHGQPATTSKGYPALPGDRVRLVRCTDGLTGEVTHDLWIAKKDSPSWQKLAFQNKIEDDDLSFVLLSESEIKVDDEGRFFANFFMKAESPLAAALAAVAAVVPK